MALAVAFDTHKFVRKLKGAGFNDQQAEALTDAVQEAQTSLDVATKQDIADVRREIADSRKDVKQDIEDVRLEIGDLRKDMDVKHESLRKDIDTRLANMKFELLRWFFAIALAQTGLLVSLKLFL